MVTAGYLLYLDRAGRAGRVALSGRQGRNFVGAPGCPWVALFLDEFDNLVKRSGDKKVPLPNGDKKIVWDMLVDLGSKARSYGIELVYATQRTTNTWAGGLSRSMNDLLTMCNTRFVVQDLLQLRYPRHLEEPDRRSEGRSTSRRRAASLVPRPR